MKNDILEIQGKLFKVYRIVPESIVNKDKDGVTLLKTLWHCDRAFKHNNQYYFVRDIDDIEFETL